MFDGSFCDKLKRPFWWDVISNVSGHAWLGLDSGQIALYDSNDRRRTNLAMSVCDEILHFIKLKT